MGLGLLRRLKQAAGAGQEDVRSVVDSVVASLEARRLPAAERAGAIAALTETLEELVRRGVAERATVDSCAAALMRLRGDGGGP